MTECCPICQASTLHPRCIKHGIPIMQCRACDLAFADHPLSDGEAAGLYGRQYFHNEETAVGYRDYDRLAELKRRTFEERLAEIERLAPVGRLLDVGCAAGFFVDLACQHGWEATGIDISAFAIERARQRQSGTFTVADLMTSTFPPNSFEVITMFDVIEHVRQPVEVLTRAAALLKRQGVLVIETPNVGGWLSRVMGRRWPYYRPPEHLFYFSPKSLHVALHRSHFTLLFWRTSIKRMTIKYIVEMLQLTNPRIAGALSWLDGRMPWAGSVLLRVPTGSFLVFARAI